ncbi:EWS RNA-binding protein 1b isoform X2 [Electrophorus electricus]|uniref:EWS RNA-binding protein 1b n=1 Tax=Electrophorus electricus TaxID=8005 RepID=A0A4W4FQ76_ELEEL|nr:EWS RNA-binding protein 1b isoform X2 [Electrophorus electricus]
MKSADKGDNDYSGYNQAGAQQAYSSYGAQPAQGYGQTQAYTQQEYGSYTQPSATESSYGQTASSAAGYAQQQYGASYGQSATPAGYGVPQPSAQSYSQPAQGYGASSYATATTAPPPQVSYGNQPAYSTQPAYSAYSQQPAASAAQSYSAGSQPSYTQAAYSQQQGGYQTQQPGYGGQQQPSAYGHVQSQQAPSVAYPPQPDGTYSQPPQSQYSQHGGPQSSYPQTPHYNSYSQGGVSGYPASQQQSLPRGAFPGPGDPSGSGRDSYERAGLRGGPRGRGLMGRAGMGMAGDRGGFSKPGGPMRDGLDREMGHPGEQDDSENSTIYITGLTENATLPEMADFFKHCGPLRINRRTGQPAINIYTDKDSGKPKGDATLSYEEPFCARAAVDYFNGKEFQGRRLNVSMARRKVVPGAMRGGMSMRGGDMMERGGLMGRGAERGGFPPRGALRGGMGWAGPPGGNNVQKRAGDWECPNPGCANQNFSWRTECNQCKAPKPEGVAPPAGGERGRGGMVRGGRGMDRGGPGGMRGGWAGEPGAFRGGRGGLERGGFRGGPPMDRGGRRGMGPPGKMDMRDHRQERRDRPY